MQNKSDKKKKISEQSAKIKKRVIVVYKTKFLLGEKRVNFS